MDKRGATKIKRGQAITFRIPSDTPDHIIRQLEHLKETERRNFSSKIASFVTDGVSNALSKEKETITVPLPKALSKEQKNWLKHAHSEALLGSIIYQLLADPIRATTILAALNSSSLNIDEALYLQEEEEQHDNDAAAEIEEEEVENLPEPILDETEDDLNSFDWEMFRQEQASSMEQEKPEKEEEDPLKDFLASMNK
ncbi:hypothetical protein LS684_19870 [Cytobacillus spongiae]|jgi:hypothetical protein|uniref:hypothetical protein n=1 Tax=Cytobacillus spongiae TaxID=2901381 RepID=UPI001F2458C8|nr:hypothetical protein [Cytobacillus spongiae]UII55849.1 hypothetical protein LS684_19870 [Cytobacillus spongiae]